MMQKKLKPKIKVTNVTMKLRFDVAHSDAEYMKKFKKMFALSDMAKMFGVSKQLAWYWTSDNPKYQTLPSKETCHHCRRSNYSEVSKWINDGSLNHLLTAVKKAVKK